MKAAVTWDANAAIVSKDPLNVSRCFWAAPSNMSFMASEKSSKETLPSLIMSVTSSFVTPIWSASFCCRPIPRSINWAITSPSTWPRAATFDQIDPISPMDTPEWAAESATRLRVSWRSWPGLIPELSMTEATWAVSPMRKEVPSMDLLTLPIIWSMSLPL